MNFWDVLVIVMICFVFLAYLVVLVSIISDIFRDHALPGWAKALWMIAMVFLPILTAVLYLFLRGSGMAERSAVLDNALGNASISDEIAKAVSMRDAGIIDDTEFETIKAKALNR
ncbi:SHOCT domain-containing protein [Brachybacterium saurashtrense]|uniref:SHOCT domain-containing protein n=1 Tax=Brachybacterium saurashtrense TaxID=556288 RepID=A0A345YLX4_9MICO|nr:SHOCT domain-containing protein [Brachybacterium saurashtrense]AXK44926.1 SHOCT domain-containing protein [Brachybacterium saurashtrense]RRR21610.1 SHOCT domain-containing protein [Brachybacterium saurashtrense]